MVEAFCTQCKHDVDEWGRGTVAVRLLTCRDALLRIYQSLWNGYMRHFRKARITKSLGENRVLRPSLSCNTCRGRYVSRCIH